jgi:KDO2-lipid IV(A) lauroyltransferase
MQTKITFQHRLEYAGFRLIAGLFSALPLEQSSRFGGWLWRKIAPLDRRHQRALANLAQAYPDMTLTQREAIARDMWDNLGRVFAESFHLIEIVESGRVLIDEASIKAMPADRRFVAAAIHQGNWELGAAVLRISGGSAGGIYQRLKNPLVDDYVRCQRAPFYPGGLWPKQGAAGRRALRHLRGGGVLATMADLRDRDGLMVAFFGRPAPSSTFPALAARATGAPLLAVEVVRLPGVRFQVSLRNVAMPETPDRAADIEAATRALHEQFETSIRRHPEQWMWASRRWG